MNKQEQHSHIAKGVALIFLVLLLAFVIIFTKIIYLQEVEGDKLLTMSDSLRGVNKELIIKAQRGNIYSDDGQLLAATMLRYRPMIDLSADAIRKDNGKKFWENVDSLSICLSKLLKDKSSKKYREELVNGYKSKKKLYLTNSKTTISHAQYREMCTFPMLREGKVKGGFNPDVKVERQRPYGSLAARTVGMYNNEKNSGTSGIEHAFNDYLTGIDGVGTLKRAAGLSIIKAKVNAKNGADVTSTLNVVMQDICEQALRHKIMEVNADCGAVILMEVKTGQIKAIVNLNRKAVGDSANYVYRENKSIALTSNMEPGSTFKVPALMAALEDGTVSLTDSVDCENGIWMVNNKVKIEDFNTDEKANHVIPVSQVIVRSSNVGIGKVILERYDNQEKAQHFVDILHRMGVDKKIDIGFTGCVEASVKGPKERKNSGEPWNYTDIANMSFGYGVNMPLLYTLNFYNAIANNGCMMSPYLVKHISRNGETLKKFEPQVMQQSICKSSTLEAIKPLLLSVVEDEHGTAKPAYSRYVRIAGKTGTARIDYGEDGKKIHHQVFFCGFFPYENPRYSGIVYMQRPRPRRGGVGGGSICGPVFREIAERVMASVEYIAVDKYVTDSGRSMWPNQTNLRAHDAITILTELGVKDAKDWKKQGYIHVGHEGEQTWNEPVDVENGMPDLRGMGLRDAIFTVERAGKRVRLVGKRGKVRKYKIDGDIVTLVIS